MKSLFLPAWTANSQRQWLRYGTTWPWQQGSEGYYPHALYSYHFWASKYYGGHGKGLARQLNPPTELLKDFQRADQYVFGDSGGFSVFQPPSGKGALGRAYRRSTILANKFDPGPVVRWQAKWCTVGCILDAPAVSSAKTRKTKMGKPSMDRHWAESLEFTKRTTALGLPIYQEVRGEGSPFRWWGVIHGSPGEQMERWWREISEIYPFTDAGEGWAVKPEPLINPITTARALHFVREHNMPRVHFLMCGAPKVSAVLHALGPLAGIEWLTFDASSPVIQGKNRRFYVVTDDGVSWTGIMERFRQTGGKDTRARDFMRERCNCFGCQRSRELMDADPVWLEDTRMTYLFSFHNFYTALQVFEAQRQAASDPEYLLRTVLGTRTTKHFKSSGPGQPYDRVWRAFEGGRSESLGTVRGETRTLWDCK